MSRSFALLGRPSVTEGAARCKVASDRGAVAPTRDPRHSVGCRWCFGTWHVIGLRRVLGSGPRAPYAPLRQRRAHSGRSRRVQIGIGVVLALDYHRRPARRRTRRAKETGSQGTVSLFCFVEHSAVSLSKGVAAVLCHRGGGRDRELGADTAPPSPAPRGSAGCASPGSSGVPC